MDNTGALLASTATESPCPVNIYSLIPHFEGATIVRTHMNEISSLSFFSNDVLLTGGQDGIIRMTFRGSKDKKPKVLRQLSTGEGAIHDVARVGTKNETVSGTQSGKVEWWDLAKGAVKTSLRLGPSPIVKVDYLPASERRQELMPVFLAVGLDGVASLLDLRSKDIVNQFSGLLAAKQTVAKHPSDSLIVSVMDNGSVKAIDLRTSVPLFSLKRRNAATSLAFSSNGDRLYIGNKGGIIEEIEFWRLIQNKPCVTEGKTISFNEATSQQKVLNQVDRVGASVNGLQRDLDVDLYHSETNAKI